MKSSYKLSWEKIFEDFKEENRKEDITGNRTFTGTFGHFPVISSAGRLQTLAIIVLNLTYVHVSLAKLLPSSTV